jgi:predicted transcriptional regulator
MRLHDYLRERRETATDFARRIGTTQAAVTRYLSGDRVPRPKILQRITLETGGAVTANDFVLPALEPVQ